MGQPWYDHDMDAWIHDAFPMHTNSDNDDDAYTTIKDWDPEAFTNEYNVHTNGSKKKLINIITENTKAY